MNSYITAQEAAEKMGRNRPSSSNFMQRKSHWSCDKL